MRRKITYNAKTAYSDSDIKTEMTEDGSPVRKKAKTNRQGSSSDTISTEVAFVTPLSPPLKYLNRNRFTSLWIALPRADQSQLLEFVLEDKLIEGLPERFKVFLTNWLLSVQQQMIQMLKDDELKKTIESVNIEAQEHIKRSDEKLYIFLEKVLRTVFQAEQFVIFKEGENDWLKYIRNLVQKEPLKRIVDETNLKIISLQLNKKAKNDISSFFIRPNRKNSKEEAKVYSYYILRFVLKFAFNTLRHVFKFDSENSTFFYDGDLEQKEISYQKSKLEKVAEKQAIGLQTYPIPTPVTCSSTSNTISMDLISAIPFGAPSKYLERNEYPSLWITLPEAEKSQLLKFVLEDDLIKDLSKGGKRFLTDWLLSVQQQMIQMLKNDDLRKTIESMKVKCQESVMHFDKRLPLFLQGILKTVFNTQRFAILERKSSWLTFISSFVKNKKLKKEVDEDVLMSVFNSLDATANSKLSPFFPVSGRNSEVVVCYYHILRFALKFALNTLRHVFKFDSENSTFFYDGELEEGGISYQTSDWEKVAEEHDVKPQVAPFPTPVISGTISMDPIAAIAAPSMYLDRNELPSLWITLPRADQSQLLKFVLGKHLIRLLPERFKTLLTDWLLSVQQKMIETLKRDGLRNTIESLIKCHEPLKRSDERLCFFLEKVMIDVFETKQFAIFEGERVWIDFIRSFVRDMSLTENFEKTELKIVSKQLNQCAQREVMSLFSGSDRRKDRESRIYFYRILRFALMFALNTLRHVFKFDSENSTFFYDGELEEGGISYQTSDWEKVTEERDVKSQVAPFTAPTTNGSTSGTISKNPTTVVSFAAPSIQVAEERDVKPQLLLAVPFAAPVQKPQSHLLPKEVVPTVPPPNVPSSSNIEDKMSQYMQFFDSSLVPQKWLNAFKMVVQHNEYLKSQEARLEARYKELKAEVQEMKEEKRRRMI
ncbi:unnamed protein product [Caenorhabditis nigoni]